MKDKITLRLIIYFLIVIALFSIITGIIYIYVGQKNIEVMSINYTVQRAERISRSITSALSDSEIMGISESDLSLDELDSLPGTEQKESRGKGREHQKPMHSETGRIMGPRRSGSPGRHFLKWLNDLLLADIRIVDLEQKWIEVGLDKAPISFEELNEHEARLVKAASEGRTETFSETSYFGNKTKVLVATPIVDENENITAVMLLEDNLDTLPQFVKSATNLFFISMIIGIILTTILAIFFAARFIKPINAINASTQKMINGDYEIQVGVEQNDEIGVLANNIETLANRLEQARSESETLDQLKDDFISSMSHELKTPVTVIKSSLEALNAGLIDDSDTVKEYHEILFKESTTLEKLISDLTDLNILRNKKYELKKEEVNMVEILNDSVRSQSLLASGKNIEIKKEVSESFLAFEGDYTKLRQMFIIVINNAVKYSKENTSIVISAKTDKNHNSISVTNSGKKIPDEIKKRIFEPFYREENNKIEGTGLGLTIANEIANHHNMKIDVKSDDVKTTFTFIW